MPFTTISTASNCIFLFGLRKNLLHTKKMNEKISSNLTRSLLSRMDSETKQYLLGGIPTIKMNHS